MKPISINGEFSKTDLQVYCLEKAVQALNDKVTILERIIRDSVQVAAAHNSCIESTNTALSGVQKQVQFLMDWAKGKSN